jgi:hypothetical protein
MVYSDVAIESGNISNLQKLIGAIVDFLCAYAGVWRLASDFWRERSFQRKSDLIMLMILKLLEIVFPLKQVL